MWRPRILGQTPIGIIRRREDFRRFERVIGLCAAVAPSGRMVKRITDVTTTDRWTGTTMTDSELSRMRTRQFARVLGPFLTIVAAVAVLRAPDMKTLLSEFTATAVWPWVMGAFATMGGIAIIAFHQYWRSAAAIIVSAIGWIVLVRGILLLAFPDTFTSLADHAIGATGWWRGAYVVLIVVGLYLTYEGWAPERHGPHSRRSDDTQDTLRVG